MARSEDISNAIWDEADFYALSAPAKLVYIWSWTNRRCDFCGIYQVPVDAISSETKLATEDVKAALAELQQAEFVFYDGVWLFVKARVKRIRTRTVQMCKAIAKDLARVPESHPFREKLLSLHGGLVWQSKDMRRTIREELDSLSGHTHEVPTIQEAEPITGSDPSETRVVPWTGTGTGTGTRTRSRGEQRADVARASARRGGSYKPTEKATELQRQWFPSHDLGAIDGALMMLKQRRLPATAENVADMLGVRLGGAA